MATATCSIANAQASTAYTATADYTDSSNAFDSSSGSGWTSFTIARYANCAHHHFDLGHIWHPAHTDAPPVAPATGAVTYAVDADAGGTATGCAISSGALSSTSAGTCIVTATKATDGNYSPTSSPATTITVAKAAQPTPPTITNLPSQGTYGGAFVAAVGNTIGGGVTSVTSNTPAVCTASGLSVSYVGVGTCSLTAQIATSTNYLAASGSAQTFSIGRAQASTPTITNLPTGAVEFAGFTADIGTTGDGTTSVVSSTPGVCKVESDGQTVLFITTGACTLTPSVATGNELLWRDWKPADVPNRPGTSGLLAGRVRRRHLLVRFCRLPRFHGRSRSAASRGRHHAHFDSRRLLARRVGWRHLQLR